MIYHTRLVMRGVRRALVVADMPFMTYRSVRSRRWRTPGRLIKEGGAHAVKLEGGVRSAAAVAAITAADIPLMGHIGLTPQSVRRLGGFKVQRDAGRTARRRPGHRGGGGLRPGGRVRPDRDRRRASPRRSRSRPSASAPGPHCDGQMLVTPDLLGLFDDIRPRFVKQYADLGGNIRQAVGAYCREVRDGTFPAAEHGFR